MNVTHLCLQSLHASSGRQAIELAMYIIVFALELLSGLLSAAFLIKARVFCGGKTDQKPSGDSPLSTAGLMRNYLPCLAVASFCKLLQVMFLYLKRANDTSVGDVLEIHFSNFNSTAAAFTDRCASRQLHAQSYLYFGLQFIFEPFAIASSTLALSIPLLRLFDVSNIAHGPKRREIGRRSRVAMTLIFVSCNAVVAISCFSAAALSFTFRGHHLDAAIASCEASQTLQE
jgi:hypothetical protein